MIFSYFRENLVPYFIKVIILVRMVLTVSESVTVTKESESDIKSGIWKQFLFAFLASLPFFTHGVETTELSASAHSGHFLASVSQVPWTTTSMILAAAASAPVYCYLMDRMGRRSGIYLVNLVQGASCIPLFLPQTEISSIFLHVLAGVSSGGLFTVIPAYVREISDDRIRGITLSLMLIMTTAGYLVYLVMDLEVMMFLMVALIATQFLTMLFLVESPSYLVMVGKIEPAKKSIAKLKHVSEDEPGVGRIVDAIKDECDRARAKGNLNLWRILKDPLYRDITKIGLVLNTTIVLSGSIIFLDQEKTLAQLKMNLDAEKTLVLVCMACGSLLTVGLIRFIDRKIYLTIAFTIMVLSTGLLAVYTQTDLTVLTLRWVPVVSLGVLVFAYGCIWGLPAVVMAEMLNIEIRSKILGLLFVYAQLVKLAHVHSFQYVEQHMGIYTLLYIFASVHMFGGVYSLFIMPTVKDKTVRQIERQMKRIPLLKFNTIKA